MSRLTKSVFVAFAFLLVGSFIRYFSEYPEAVKQCLIGMAGLFALMSLAMGFITNSR